MIHAILSAITCAILIVCGLNWTSCFWPAAFYLGREIAQSEYRYIQSHGGKRANCPWYCGFLPEAWTVKSVVDCVLPWISCVVMAIMCIFVRGW